MSAARRAWLLLVLIWVVAQVAGGGCRGRQPTPTPSPKSPGPTQLAASTAPIGLLADVSPTVSVRTGGKGATKITKDGAPIRSGDVVVTDRTGGARVSIPGEQKAAVEAALLADLIIEPDTEVELRAASQPGVIAWTVLRGSVALRLLRGGSEGGSPILRAGAVGTAYSVDYDPSARETRVIVIDGEISCSRVGDESARQTVIPGMELVVAGDPPRLPAPTRAAVADLVPKLNALLTHPLTTVDDTLARAANMPGRSAIPQEQLRLAAEALARPDHLSLTAEQCQRAGDVFAASGLAEKADGLYRRAEERLRAPGQPGQRERIAELQARRSVAAQVAETGVPPDEASPTSARDLADKSIETAPTKTGYATQAALLAGTDPEKAEQSLAKALEMGLDKTLAQAISQRIRQSRSPEPSPGGEAPQQGALTPEPDAPPGSPAR
jgi:hypothetical protein